MNSVWSEFPGSFGPFFKSIWSPMKDTEAPAMVVGALSAKIADWASCLAGLYFTSAIAIAEVSLQVQTELPPMFHFLFLAILLGFCSLLFAEFVKFKSVLPTHIFRCLSLFFLVMAFFVAIAIPFPLYFKLISLIVFLASLSFIFCFSIISTA